MTDERMDVVIGNLLRAGVSVAAVMVAAGGIWYLAAGGASVPEYRQFHPAVRGLGAIARLPGPEALIGWGLLVLIATPVARVIFSLIGFTAERDWMYVGFTAIVIAILLYSIGTALL